MYYINKKEVLDTMQAIKIIKEEENKGKFSTIPKDELLRAKYSYIDIFTGLYKRSKAYPERGITITELYDHDGKVIEIRYNFYRPDVPLQNDESIEMNDLDLNILNYKNEKN